MRNAGTSQKPKIIPKDTIFEILASPMFCLQYMISSYLYFSMKQIISFKQKVFFVYPGIADCTDPTRIPLYAELRVLLYKLRGTACQPGQLKAPVDRYWLLIESLYRIIARCQ